MKLFNNISDKKIDKKIVKYVSEIKEDLLKFYESDYSSLLLPENKTITKEVLELVKKKNKYTHLVVVGIGGSNLGTMAVLEAVKSKYHLLNNNKKIFFADTTDPDNTNNILKNCKNKKFLLVIISKSGTTTETIANCEYLLKHIPVRERKDRIIMISDDDSILIKEAKKKKYDYLTIPKKIGGRYSVFSSVGLFPLSFAGINIKELLKGASDSIKNFDKNNYALKGAVDLYKNKDKKINDIFLFSNDLESLGKWFRQLMGESIGKKFSVIGKEVRTGITPTISIGSTDLHSVGQLYLGGPKDKFTSFVSVKKQETIMIPKNKDAILKDLQGLTFQDIIHAIMKGTMKAYKKNNLPYNHYELESKKEYEIGFFMQTKMLEIMLLAKLLNINAFDQPSVEDYKKETKKLLKRKP